MGANLRRKKKSQRLLTDEELLLKVRGLAERMDAQDRRYERTKTRQLRRELLAEMKPGANCPCCKKPMTKESATVEHRVAIVNGGRTDRGNCVLICMPCNLRKNREMTSRLGPDKDLDPPTSVEPARSAIVHIEDDGGLQS